MQGYLFRPVDAAPLAVFRFVFGALMVLESWAIFHKIPMRYSPHMYHFTYPGFSWVAPPPGYGIYAVVLAMGAAAFCLALGYRYRLAAAAFFLLYTYVFLIEQTAYNNHYYLIILLGLLFVVTDAHADAAMDNTRNPASARGWVPRWQLLLFRTQIVLVYFFGGIAKLNSDWLQRQPIDQWLHNRAATHMLGDVLDMPWVAYLFAYGGLAFDLSIGFLLTWRRTRPIAIVMVLAFHITNSYIFTIGIFPWLGIGATVLFLEPATLRRILEKSGFSSPAATVLAISPMRQPWAITFCMVFLAIQVVLPLRHWAYPGNVNWTEEGHLFSWHMKLRDKASVVRFRVIADGMEKKLTQDDLRRELSPKQIYSLGSRPRLAAQYAHHLREMQEAHGHRDVEVHVEALASLNGRAFQPIIDPRVDLSWADTNPFRPADWIVPLNTALPAGVYADPPAWAAAEGLGRNTDE